MKKISSLLLVFLINHMSYGTEIDYKYKLNDIKIKRKEFSELYKNNKEESLNKSKEYLLEKSNELIRDWYGTSWDFNGVSDSPKIGKIACGYFVTTILRDLDFNLDRIAMGNQPSEYIIKNLVEKDIKKIKNLEELNNFIDGLYIIGLDNHTGYIYKNKEDIQFCHSSFISSKQVLCEKALDSIILKSSKYKVLGRLFDKKLLEKWLFNERIKLDYDYFKKR